MTGVDRLIDFGWAIAEATLAGATSELTLVTHWFQTAEDETVNADEHFGSDERTLRFIAVALPTLVDQLDAGAAVVVVPWGLSPPDPAGIPASTPTLSVVAWPAAGAAIIASRSLTRLGAGPVPPFWRLEPDPVEPPSQLARTVSRLAR